MKPHDLARIASPLVSQTDESAEALAYMAKVLVQATLPHSDPGDVPVYVRRNGDLTLALQPAFETGVPYGPTPRLLLVWMTTEAVRTRSRTLVLGDTLSSFMRQLDMVPTGGRWGTITRLREQLTRLLGSRVTARRTAELGESFVSIEMAKSYDLWWEPKKPAQGTLWQSTLTLGESFYELLTEAPVPLDFAALKVLRRSPLGLDLYAWATHRLSYARAPVEVSWAQLHAQFGAEYAAVNDFAAEARKELRRIAALWPELAYETPRGRLILRPSPTHVRRADALRKRRL